MIARFLHIVTKISVRSWFFQSVEYSALQCILIEYYSSDQNSSMCLNGIQPREIVDDANRVFHEIVCTCKKCTHDLPCDCAETRATYCKERSHSMAIDGILGSYIDYGADIAHGR
jgi:hypothetical protein